MRRLPRSFARSVAIGLSLLLVAGAVSWLVFAVQRSGRVERQRAAESSAARSLAGAVGEVLAQERTLARVVRSVGDPSPERWRALSQIVLVDKAANGTGWIVPVTERRRDDFQRARGVTIVAVPRPGVVVTAPHSGVHWVVMDAVERAGGRLPLIGADLATNRLREGLLARAAATGRPQASPPVRLLLPGAGTGVIVFEPVRAATGRLLGWVTASYTPSTLVAALREQAPGLHLSVSDGDQVIVADRVARQGSRATVPVGGRSWTVSVWVPETGASLVPWLVLTIGLLITVGVVLSMRAVENRERYALELVQSHVAVERQHQAELEERTRELAEAQAIAGMGSWWWDPSSGSAGWSDEMYRLFARDRDLGPAIGPAFFDYVHPDDRPRIEAGYARTLGGGQRFEVEFRIIVAGTTQRVHAVCYRHFTGRYVGTVQDVTALRRVEQEQALLAAIVSQTETAILAKSSEGVVIEWNAGAERLYGYSAAEIKGKPIAILVPPERAGEDQALLERAMAGEAIQQFETVRIRKDGSGIEVSLAISPLREVDGTITGAIVVVRDVTARKSAERARAQAEAQLRVTVEHAPTGVALAELPTGRLISVNAAMSALTGYPDHALKEMALTSLAHPDDDRALRRDLALLTTDESARVELELRLLHRDGHLVTAQLAAAGVPAADGRSLAVIHLLNITERKRFEGQLQYLADHDGLTSLYNRRRFESELERAVAHAARYGSRGTVLLIDLDGFKYVNDTMGHSHGDELVMRVGELLQNALRETDVIARLGGDEFAVIVSQADQQEGVLVAEKLLEVLRDRAIVLTDERYARVTASIGLTTFNGQGMTAEELIVEADIAMYEAKEQGKNQVAVYDRRSGSRAALGARQSWLDRLSAAIEQRRFELYAQPIRGICANGIERYELLLRLRGDDEELIPPGTFLYLAERFDLIQQIDRQVFAEAATLLREHDSAGNDLSLTVNMSAKTLADPRLIRDLRAILQACPIPHDRLIVEVTETAAIVNIDKARSVARALRQLGCQFALDDFGAGFASFYYLKHLDFDYLKIDGEFVQNVVTNHTDQLVVKSVVDIARGLGAQTIAEFVTDEDAVERLRELGVDYGQGYHLGRPGPLTQVLPGLTRRTT